MSSDFNWYLNRQGLRGLTGEKGDQGFSPYFTVEESTANQYRLRVHNENDSFVTENLRGNAIEIRNPDGNYIKYDHNTGDFYVDDADYATTDSEGQVILATINDVVIGNETKAVTPALLLDSLPQLLVNNDSNLTITQNQDNSLTEINLADEIIHPNLNYAPNNNYLITGDIRYRYPITVTKGVLDDTGRRGCTFGLNYNTSHFQLSNNSLSLSTAIINNINFIRNDLEDEKTTRGNADNQLRSEINAERREREQQDSDLTAHINLVRTESETSDTLIRQEIQNTKSSLEESLEAKISADNINAGANITIDKDGNNITINSTGGSTDNLVTLNTNQSITGQKTFTKQVNVPSGVLKSTDGVFVIEGNNNANIRINNLTIKKGTTGSNYGLELSGGTSGSTILFDNTDLRYRNDEGYVYSLLTYDKLTSKDGSIEITYNNTTGKVDLKAVGGGGSYTLPIASANTLGGIKGGNWLTVNQTTGKLECGELSYSQYQSALGYTFISKTTLENVLANRPSGGAEIDDENVSTSKVFSSSKTSDLVGEVGNDLQDLTQRVNNIESLKVPNVVIVGEPLIQDGQVSGLDQTNHLQFPFILERQGRSWEYNGSFTTGSNITNQQNIIDSKCSIALAVRNSRLVIALSSNGTTFNLGEHTLTDLTIQPNTTYYVKISYIDNMGYVLEADVAPITYGSPHLSIGHANTPIAATTMLIGSDGNSFSGTLDLNKWSLKVDEQLVWLGMDNVGQAVSANVSLSNINEAGRQVIREAAGVENIEEALNLLNGGDSTLLDSKQNKLVAGNGITIDPETNVISATGGGGSGDVTLDGDNTFTGRNTFENQLTLKSGITIYEYGGTQSQDIYLNYLGNLVLGNNVQFGNISINSSGVNNTIRDSFEGNYFLTQGTIEQGDNVTIEKTFRGLKISATGGGGGADNIFVAEYGTTTYDEVKAAYDAGKQVFVDYNSGSYNLRLRLTRVSSSIMDFSSMASTSRYSASLSSTNVWTRGSGTIPATTTSVISGSSSALTSGGAYTNLVRKDELQNVIPVISRVVSGSSQVTIWADGYCEQCGLMNRTAAKESVSLAKAYTNSDYNIIIQPRHTADSTDGRPPLIRDVTPNSFEINSYTTYAQFYWVTKGMLAEGEY